MPLDTKQKVLLLLYKEYQKDKPQMYEFLSNIPKIAESLDTSEKAVVIAIDKLQNEGYITGARFFEHGPSFDSNSNIIPPGKVIYSDSDIKLTRNGIKYAEELEKNEFPIIISNKQKILINLYNEYQKDESNIFQFIKDIPDTIKEEFNIAIDKLQNEGFITGAEIIPSLPSHDSEGNYLPSYKNLNPFSDIKLTKEGIDYVEELLEIKKPSSNNDEINNLIAEGESSDLEFKSSLRWDIKENCVNKALENVILKSIAAFNNSEGGTLIIGVNDTGEVLGLENDYNSLKKDNKPDVTKDDFELHLRNLINKTFGVSFASMHIDINFKIAHEKEVCVINIKRGDEPLFLAVSDKHGQKHDKFYVRNGNRSDEIIGLSNITSYIRKRFDTH